MSREESTLLSPLEVRVAEADNLLKRSEEIAQKMKSETEQLTRVELSARGKEVHDLKPSAESATGGDEIISETFTVIHEVTETRLEMQEGGEGAGLVDGQSGAQIEVLLEATDVTVNTTTATAVETTVETNGFLEGGIGDTVATVPPAVLRPVGTSDLELFGEPMPPEKSTSIFETAELEDVFNGQPELTQADQPAPASTETLAGTSEAAAIPSLPLGSLRLAPEEEAVTAAPAVFGAPEISVPPSGDTDMFQAGASAEQTELAGSELPVKLEHKISVGDRVEACTSEEGLHGAWFLGTIQQIENSVALVKFDELLNDDGVTKLEELYPTNPPWTISFTADGKVADDKAGDAVKTLKRLVRPISPAAPLSTEKTRLRGGTEVNPWTPGDRVEVLYDDAWWEAVVTSVSGKNVTVYYPGEVDAGVVSVDDVRPALVFVDGFWVVNTEKASVPVASQEVPLAAAESKAKRQKTEAKSKAKKEKPAVLKIGGKPITPKRPLLMMTVKQAKRLAAKEKKDAAERKAAAKGKAAKGAQQKAGAKALSEAKAAKSPAKRAPQKKIAPQAKAKSSGVKSPVKGTSVAKQGLKVRQKKVTVRTPVKKTPSKSPAKKAASKPSPKKPVPKSPAKKAASKPSPKKRVSKPPGRKAALKSPAKTVPLKSPAEKEVSKPPAKKAAHKPPALKAAAAPPVKKAASKSPAKKAVNKLPPKKPEVQSPRRAAPKRSARNALVKSPAKSLPKPAPKKAAAVQVKEVAKPTPVHKAAPAPTAKPPSRAPPAGSPAPLMSTRKTAVVTKPDEAKGKAGPSLPTTVAARDRRAGKAAAKVSGKGSKEQTKASEEKALKSPGKSAVSAGKEEAKAKAKAQKPETPASVRSSRSRGPALDQAQAVQQALAEAKVGGPSRLPARKTPEKKAVKGKGAKALAKSPARTPARATVVIETRVTRRSLTVVSPAGPSNEGTTGKRKRDVEGEVPSSKRGKAAEAGPAASPPVTSPRRNGKAAPKPAKGAAKKGKQEVGAKRQKKEVSALLEASPRTTRHKVGTAATPPPITGSPATRLSTRATGPATASGGKRKRGAR